jgi:3'-5' exoribonuclease
MDGIEATKDLRLLAKVHKVEGLAQWVLDKSGWSDWTASGSSHSHHYGQGGLAVHTLEVVNLCLLNNHYFAPYHQDVDPKLLFLAALFHDVGKLWDYEPKTAGDYSEWKNTDHKNKIHHIVKSMSVWEDAVLTEVNTINAEESHEIIHAILAHHGQKEWGSPVTPQTAMAWILHLSDMTSARLYDEKVRKGA